MKELIWLGSRRARWQAMNDPAPPLDHEALVRPVAVACCDLDVWTVRGAAPLPGPFRVGHEGVAEVVAVGARVETIRPGDRVIVPYQVSCGQCAACRRGRTETCASVPVMAMYGMAPLAGFDAGGFMSDAVRVPFADAMLVKLPVGIDVAAAASLSDNVVDGWRGIGAYASELEALEPADRRVLVIGHGSIGLYAAAVGVAIGVHVDYVDTDPSRLTTAHSLGATAVDSPLPRRELGSYPVTMSTRPDPEALHATLRSTWPGGVCTDAAVHFGGDVAMPLLAMYTRGVRYVTGRVSARASIPSVLELLMKRGLRTDPVTEQIVGWDEADSVWPHMTGKTIFVRT